MATELTGKLRSHPESAGRGGSLGLSLEHRRLRGAVPGQPLAQVCPHLRGDSCLQTAPAVPELPLAAVQGHVLQGWGGWC